MVDYINTYRREIAAFFANSTATHAGDLAQHHQTKQLHYLRISNPVNPEVLTSYQKRLSSNRGNPYMDARRLLEAPASGLRFSADICARNNPQPTIGPTIYRLTWRRSSRRLLHVPPGWAAMQGAGAARHGNNRATSSIPPTTTLAMSRAALLPPPTRSKHKERCNLRRIIISAPRSPCWWAPRSPPRPRSTPTPPELKFSPTKAGQREQALAAAFTETYNAASDSRRQPRRAAGRHQDHDLRRQGNPKPFPICEGQRSRSMQVPTVSARRRRWSPTGPVNAKLGRHHPEGPRCSRATRSCTSGTAAGASSGSSSPRAASTSAGAAHR